jgi:hypothetical protein
MMEQARQRVHELEQQQLMASVGHGSNYTTIQPQINHNENMLQFLPQKDYDPHQ